MDDWGENQKKKSIMKVVAPREFWEPRMLCVCSGAVQRKCFEKMASDDSRRISRSVEALQCLVEPFQTRRTATTEKGAPFGPLAGESSSQRPPESTGKRRQIHQAEGMRCEILSKNATGEFGLIKSKGAGFSLSPSKELDYFFR